ncbi:MAG: type II toxin-antitoxin system VapC family toxin [Tannerella sp.]|jgi:predicted nucleic acid-binding protein|nr:type II toxin-antitoxin system VapC family toxin [Tannerella sp.]
MGQEYLIDSNVIIDYTSERIPSKGSDFVEEIFEQQFLISVIVEIEVLGFGDIPRKMAALEEFLEMACVIPLDEKITKRTIDLRRKYKKLKLGDAIIAATAFDMILCS